MPNQYSKDYETLDRQAYEMIINGTSLTKTAKIFKMNRDKLIYRLNLKYDLDVSSRKGNKKNVNSNYFSKWNHENSYWFGLILADGNISKDLKKFEITLKDKEHIEKFKQCLNSEHKIGTKNIHGKKYYRISIEDKELVKSLYDKGILPNKSNINFDLPNIPDMFFNDFLRGLIDGDGSYYLRYTNKAKTNQSPYISIHIGFSCEKYLYQLKEKIEHLYSVNVNIYRKKTVYSLNISAKSSKKIIKEIYNDTNLYLERKYKKISKFT